MRIMAIFSFFAAILIYVESIGPRRSSHQSSNHHGDSFFTQESIYQPCHQVIYRKRSKRKQFF